MANGRQRRASGGRVLWRRAVETGELMAGSDWQGKVTTSTGGEEQKTAGREDGARSADGGARVRGAWILGGRGKRKRRRGSSPGKKVHGAVGQELLGFELEFASGSRTLMRWHGRGEGRKGTGHWWLFIGKWRRKPTR
ncbi:hypothetical protein E2562_027448 [Oryza meyeriana var. granulata]|uniref:DUF834 domain-containing protein n=1 Tax=Oryza meyeriana var. granulata TaxID=110450 RepID=A0A6G1CIX9_9ORYZ|nr:hypothetical protein E2562_027448 [Oryza meyeriana var. granulata]